MFTRPIPYSHDDYEAVSFAHLLKPLGIEAGGVEMGTPFLSVPDDVSRKAAGLLEMLHDQTFVTIFPGASIAERRWGADRFRRVAEMLSIFGIKTVVVGGKEDRQQGKVITAGGLGLNLAGMTMLSESAAVIQKSSLLLSGDSGVLHIAVGLGVPTVSLFGPGRAKKWAPQGDRHIVINKRLPCSPCTTFGTTPPCPINAQCMRDISVDEVANTVTMLLTSVGAMPSQCCKRDWIETT
jgi:ADP-heptose:LPS heptosyltransferase